MRDRNVEYPNRFRLVKVRGTDDVYDLVAVPGNVVDEGTYLSKGTLLSDTVAARMDLRQDDPTVNDALAVLADIGNVHIWQHTYETGEYEFVTDAGSEVALLGPTGSDITVIWQVGSNLAMVNGEIVLAEVEQEFELTTSNTSAARTAFRKKYIYNPEKGLYYIPSTVNFTYSSTGSRYVRVNPACGVTAKASMDTEYRISPHANGYSGDGYIPLGTLGRDGVHQEILSYVGNGMYGASYACSLTAERPIVYIRFLGAVHTETGVFDNFSDTLNYTELFADVLTTEYVASRGFGDLANFTDGTTFAKKSADGKTISWYETAQSLGPTKQLNANKYTHYFLVLSQNEEVK